MPKQLVTLVKDEKYGMFTDSINFYKKEKEQKKDISLIKEISTKLRPKKFILFWIQSKILEGKKMFDKTIKEALKRDKLDKNDFIYLIDSLAYVFQKNKSSKHSTWKAPRTRAEEVGLAIRESVDWNSEHIHWTTFKDAYKKASKGKGKDYIKFILSIFNDSSSYSKKFSSMFARVKKNEQIIILDYVLTSTFGLDIDFVRKYREFIEKSYANVKDKCTKSQKDKLNYFLEMLEEEEDKMTDQPPADYEEDTPTSGTGMMVYIVDQQQIEKLIETLNRMIETFSPQYYQASPIENTPQKRVHQTNGPSQQHVSPHNISAIRQNAGDNEFSSPSFAQQQRPQYNFPRKPTSMSKNELIDYFNKASFSDIVKKFHLSWSIIIKTIKNEFSCEDDRKYVIPYLWKVVNKPQIVQSYISTPSYFELLAYLLNKHQYSFNDHSDLVIKFFDILTCNQLILNGNLFFKTIKVDQKTYVDSLKKHHIFWRNTWTHSSILIKVRQFSSMLPEKNNQIKK